MTQSESPSAQQANLIRWIMLAVLAWGLVLSLGSYLFGGNQPILRAAIVAGCTLAFLAFWLAALAARLRRPVNNEKRLQKRSP